MVNSLYYVVFLAFYHYFVSFHTQGFSITISMCLAQFIPATINIIIDFGLIWTSLIPINKDSSIDPISIFCSVTVWVAFRRLVLEDFARLVGLFSRHRRDNHDNDQGFRWCRRSSCTMCSHSDDQVTEHHSRANESWKIQDRITCTTKSVVYKLTCRKCVNFLYIGETGRRVCDRFREHKGYITQGKIDRPTGKHFNSTGHEARHLCITPIEHVQPGNNRKARENAWIAKYDSINKGQNSCS